MTSSLASLAPSNLRCEFLSNPLGIDELRPRLSWQIEDARRGAVQTAYQILVASSPQNLACDRGDLWDSGTVRSDRSAHVEYEGVRLRSRQRCFWKVRTWDASDQVSPWSEAHFWEMGLLEPDDWSAEWIGRKEESAPPPCAYLRRSFSITRPVRRARIYATALGVYQLYVNGKRVGEDILAPGWTDYRRRTLYQTYDVTGLLGRGENVVGAVLGVGWYAGPLSYTLKRNNFGDPPSRLLLQLEIEYENGEVQRVVSDGSWKSSTGPILYSEIYEGERYDARLEMPGWNEPGIDDTSWTPVDVFPPSGARLCAQRCPPIRITEELTPVAVHEPDPGIYVFDLGQNMVGSCRLRVQGPAGTEVRLRHAEVLDDAGRIDVANLRNAAQTDIYVLKGDGVETFVPHFTYHGFRYVEVSGYPGRPDLDAITGLVFHTDAEPAAALATSSEMVNRLVHNILWSQRGNLHSVPTDCPQRDERLGWTGDAQIFARTACFNMDMAAFLTKYVEDMLDTQTEDGAFSDIAPYFHIDVIPPNGAPGWADAGVLVPWTLYQQYGDRRVLERAFEPMCRYLDYVTRLNPDGLWTEQRGNDYGDWVPADSETDKVQFATLYYFNSARLVAKVARILGRAKEAGRYQELADRIRRAFNHRYLGESGYENATQTLNALALGFGIVPEEAREVVIANLVADLKKRDWHLSTGFHGTRWLLPVLSEAGRDDLAYRLLLNRDYPSWGYMIARGATTIWELWNSDVAGPEMNSRNHFAFGSVGEWLFRYLAGIDADPEEPGFKHILVHPRPLEAGSEINWVSASYDSVHGRIDCHWTMEPNAFVLDLQIPANTRATVLLPAASIKDVEESGVDLRSAEGISNVRQVAGRVVCEVGAGSYGFRVRRG